MILSTSLKHFEKGLTSSSPSDAFRSLGTLTFKFKKWYKITHATLLIMLIPLTTWRRRDRIYSEVTADKPDSWSKENIVWMSTSSGKDFNIKVGLRMIRNLREIKLKED